MFRSQLTFALPNTLAREARQTYSARRSVSEDVKGVAQGCNPGVIAVVTSMVLRLLCLEGLCMSETSAAGDMSRRKQISQEFAILSTPNMW